jgi:SPP1 gp7 family putative phage head morphogenesis protein
MRKYLRPIFDRDKYHLQIEAEIKRLLYYHIFKPVLDIVDADNLSKVRQGKFENAISNALLEALRDGTIVYVDGFFTGKMNAAIGLELRKLGARFNHVKKAYAIERYDLPSDIIYAIAKGQDALNKKVEAIYDHLEYLRKSQEVNPINFSPQLEGIIIDLDKQYSSTIPKDLSVPMVETHYTKVQLTKNYSENLNLDIKNWYDEAVLRLRKKVHDNVVEGYRAANLVDIIQAEKESSYAHALFIAKQETSLLVSNYRVARYQEAGLKRFVWSTSNDERVRVDHRRLNNHIYSFNEPPVTNRKTGARNLPGCDFGCRCDCWPVVEN